MKIRRSKKLVFIAVTIAGSFALIYSLAVIFRTVTYYHAIKHRVGFDNFSHAPDPALGFKPIANARALQRIGPLPDVPCWHDGRSFRIVPGSNPEEGGKRPVILTLGCSFTYGWAVPAELTYPQLLARSSGGVVRNAGVSGYGLGQMVIQARTLIPELKPDYVIAQFSPWLAERSSGYFNSVVTGIVPSPFFVDDGGEIDVHPPIFQNKLHALPSHEFRNREKSFGDFVSYARRVGIPILLHNDRNRCIVGIRKRLGGYPKPIKDEPVIIRYAYAEIARLARENGATLIIAMIGREEPMQLDQELLPLHESDSNNPIGLVNTREGLINALEDKTKEGYEAAYNHTVSLKGDGVAVVDYHPNAAAHAIIAEQIAAIMRKIQELKLRSTPGP